MSYCKIICMARLTADPELRTTPQGTPVCEARIAFDNGWGDNKKTCFISVTIWGKQGEFVKQYFSKGSGILIDGRLEFDTWDDKETGAKRSKHYIVAERVTFPISSSKNAEASAGASPASPAAAAGGNSQGWGAAPNADDIPF
jgi:single-strand DNA-binding protein